ncbi:hypothetical protein C435_20903 [Haloarcula marismortui ATCC 33799]|uniref:Uncharacterized protein n=1 Tax=Haloarcula marismortui ATCC 33799 TaxID=662475 RepID=M0JPF1_9EURY|nr:hypothetical protein C435_20903 [Haloarcula californiae ATCC 33799]
MIRYIKYILEPWLSKEWSDHIFVLQYRIFNKCLLANYKIKLFKIIYLISRNNWRIREWICWIVIRRCEFRREGLRTRKFSTCAFPLTKCITWEVRS